MMLDKQEYANGQKIFDYDGETLIFYFKSGKLKAKGLYLSEKMEGKWLFYRESGQLWQIGNFRQGEKHGTWKRFNKNDQLEYEKEF